MDLVAALSVTSWVPFFNTFFFLILAQGHFFHCSWSEREGRREAIGQPSIGAWTGNGTSDLLVTGRHPNPSPLARACFRAVSLPREQRRPGGPATRQRPSCMRTDRPGRTGKQGPQPCRARWALSAQPFGDRVRAQQRGLAVTCTRREAPPAESRVPPLLLLPLK